MIRFLFTCLFYTTLARWGYAELTLLIPEAMPYVNQSLKRFRFLPTIPGPKRQFTNTPKMLVNRSKN